MPVTLTKLPRLHVTKALISTGTAFSVEKLLAAQNGSLAFFLPAALCPYLCRPW